MAHLGQNSKGEEEPGTALRGDPNQKEKREESPAEMEIFVPSPPSPTEIIGSYLIIN